MIRYEESIIIRRPVEDVFEYMQDIGREHEWQPNLREAEQMPEGEPGVGTKRRYVNRFMGKRIQNVYVYTVYEPNHRVAYRSTGESDTQAAGEVTWQVMENRAKVTIRVEAQPGGPLKLIPTSVLAAVARKELAQALARVKGRLEA